jgi:hypothetical protein
VAQENQEVTLLDSLQQNKATAIGFIPKYVIEYNL